MCIVFNSKREREIKERREYKKNISAEMHGSWKCSRKKAAVAGFSFVVRGSSNSPIFNSILVYVTVMWSRLTCCADSVAGSVGIVGYSTSLCNDEPLKMVHPAGNKF